MWKRSIDPVHTGTTPPSEAQAMHLALVQAGKRVRLTAIESVRELRARLSAMGLVPGVEIEVVRNALHGPFIIAVKGSRMMLGRGMACKITVA